VQNTAWFDDNTGTASFGEIRHEELLLESLVLPMGREVVVQLGVRPK
jgi:hypothetical protein